MPAARTTAGSLADRDLDQPRVRDDDARRSASLRRIAIVLQDLPRELSDELLGSLDGDARWQLTRVRQQLTDIDPLERKRALESFTNSLRRHVRRQSGGDGPDEFVFSGATNRPSDSSRSMASADRVPAAESTPPERVPSPDPLRILTQMDDVDVLTMLVAEHPQTAAVVLAKIPPSRAAQLIPRMPMPLRQDVLMRIGRLQSVPEEMVAELAQTFARRADHLAAERQTRQLRELLGTAAIDDAASGRSTGAGPRSADVAQHIPPAALAASPSLQAILAQMSGGDSGPAPAGPLATTTDRNRARSNETTSDRGTESAGSSKQAIAPGNPLARRGTDDINAELLRLSPAALCQTLGRVSTRAAILTLCGLPNATADAVIAQLPRSQANQVRRQLASLGSIELREIDDAKQAVADAARTAAVIGPDDSRTGSPAQTTGTQTTDAQTTGAQTTGAPASASSTTAALTRSAA